MEPVLFVCEVDLNLAWTSRSGERVEIVADKRTGEPWPALQAFPVPAHLADEFERVMSPAWDDANVSPGSRGGRIAGLRRV